MQVADGIHLQLALHLLLHKPAGMEQVMVQLSEAVCGAVSGGHAMKWTYRGQLCGWTAAVCPGNKCGAAG
jgi:hypothetical protein